MGSQAANRRSSPRRPSTESPLRLRRGHTLSCHLLLQRNHLGGDDLATARLDGGYARMLTRLSRIALLILDDWAMIRLTEAQRRDLMDVIDDRHQRASTILATQIPIERWHEMIGDPTYADAILDRLVHNAHRIEMSGESMRKKNGRKPETMPVDSK